MCQIHSAVYVALQTMYRLLQVVMGLSLGPARAQPRPVQFLGLGLKIWRRAQARDWPRLDYLGLNPSLTTRGL